MQIILLERVKNLGDLGAVVDVRAGYGRNFLIPQGKALPATKDNLATVEARRAELLAQAAEFDFPDINAVDTNFTFLWLHEPH